MKNREDAIFRKITEYCDEVQSAFDMFGSDYEKFTTNIIFKNACCMPIMQIGELCKLISDDSRKQYSDIEWKGWCGIRDIMAHQYTNLDYDKVWKIVTEDRNKLKADIEKILLMLEKESIDRIQKIINENNLGDINAEDVYKSIVTNTGVSLNAFSDDKLVMYIREVYN